MAAITVVLGLCVFVLSLINLTIGPTQTGLSGTSADSIYSDTSADATCSVTAATRGSTTTIVLPIRESETRSVAERNWYIDDVTGIGGGNAIISTKQFLGAVEQGSLSFDVRPTNPDLPYSLDGIALHLTSRGDDRVDLLRLAVMSADGQCEVGAGGELPPRDRS